MRCELIMPNRRLFEQKPDSMAGLAFAEANFVVYVTFC